MKFIAHRGDQSQGIENSLPAFLAAEKNFDGIEFDVHQLGSGEFVVFHDRTTDRLTDANLRLASASLAEVQKLRLPDGAPIPTLTQVLDVLAKTTFINIELKSGNANDLVNCIDAYNRWQNTVISTANIALLRRLRQAKASAKLALVHALPRLLPITTRLKLLPKIEFIACNRWYLPFTPTGYFQRYGVQIWVFGYKCKPKHPRQDVTYFIDAWC